jgi:type I restriction enzyme S subunit
MAELATMPRYKAYKDSGFDWIGEVPENWELVPIRSIFKFRNEKNDPVITENILSLSIANGVTQYSEEGRGGNKRKDDITAYKIARPDDIVLNSMNVIVGAVGLSKYFGAISPVYYALYIENQDASIKYYERIFQNESFQRGLLKFGKGILIKLSGTGKLNTIRMKVSTDDLKTLIFPKPPFEEQVAIANFLDKKTALIDEAIAIKEKQIELLKERKKIIIQQAVTRGLNPDISMKDSGVDWIGEIPEHWGITRFKNIFSQSRLPVREGDGVVTSFRDGQVTLRSKRRLTGFTEAIIEGGYQGIRKGQFVLNSMDAFEGAIGVSDSDGKCTPEYVICNPKSESISQYYFSYLLREMALAKYIQVICNAVRQRAVRIRFNNLASRLMVLPPLKEQDEIVQYIQHESEKIDAGVAHLQSQIDKFKEYKTTLINSAVTGKIKVPEVDSGC